MKLEASKVSLKPDPDDDSTNNIPSRTTPTLPNTLCIPAMFTATTATITPTTLRNIEQAFFEINNTENESMPFQAGFVPPPATAASYHSSISADGVGGSDNEFSMDSDSMMSNSSDNGMSPVPPVTVENVKEDGGGQGKKGTKSASRKNKGGRRPNKASNLSPEEEEKRRVRRERNKMAAARCRRRREDRTKELLTETEILENKKRALQTEVEELESEKADLEYLLQTHKNSCKRLSRQENSLLHVKADPEIANTLLSLADRIKSEPMEIINNPVREHPNDRDTQDDDMSDRNDDNDDDDSDQTQSPKRKILLTSAAIDPLPTITKQDTMIGVNVPKMNRPNRPNTLNVPLFGGNSSSQALNSIPIQTPSNGIFNFESLMEGGTGLTPVQPKIMGDNSKTALDLITPTSEGTKLI